MDKIKRILFYITKNGIFFTVRKALNSLFMNSELYKRIVYKKLSNKYSDFIIECESNCKERLDRSESNKIWVLWLQGKDNAPELVKKCFSNLEKYKNDSQEIVYLDQFNYQEYISLPDYILEKHQNGMISNAHFSDILRVALLVKHGGLWIDSTVLLTGSIPVDYFSQELFFFVQENSIIRVSSWFIYSKYSNEMLFIITYNFLLKYWKDNNSLVHYFLVHLIFSMVINKSKSCSQKWNNTLKVSNQSSHLLQKNFSSSFNKEEFHNISQCSTIHKLTYKFEEQLSKDPNNYYSYIVKQ